MIRKHEQKQSAPVPPAEIILDLLNDKPRTEIELLDYYNGYIHSAATEPVYTVDGTRQGIFINEDLEQEIRIEFLKSLPVLRQKLIELLLSDQTVLVLFKKDTGQE